MKHILSQVAKLRRPRLLSRAARIASQSYKRGTELPKLINKLGLDVKNPQGLCGKQHMQLISQLIEHEVYLNAQRKVQREFYQPAEHIAVLGAIIAESDLLKRDLQAAHADQSELVQNSIRNRLKQPHMDESGVAAFFSAIYAPKASEIAGSSIGC